MKRVNTYPAQYKIIPEQPTQNQNQNHTKNTARPHKKKLTNDRQEFIGNISASGFKPFNL